MMNVRIRGQSGKHGLTLSSSQFEKVLAAIGAKFLRAADAFDAVRRGGPHRPEQNLSATFFFA
jgi:hypothetical protein